MKKLNDVLCVQYYLKFLDIKQMTQNKIECHVSTDLYIFSFKLL